MSAPWVGYAYWTPVQVRRPGRNSSSKELCTFQNKRPWVYVNGEPREDSDRHPNKIFKTLLRSLCPYQ